LAAAAAQFKKKATEEELATAKEQYGELFTGKDTFEVRLRNKSLAMKKGKLVGMGDQNKYAIFESRKMFVAVPADKLHKKLSAKTEDLFEKASKILTDTGVACDDVLDIPEDFEEKVVGLSNREKIAMYVYKKPKADKKKKAKEKKTVKDESKSAEKKS